MIKERYILGVFFVTVQCFGREIPDNQGKEFIIGFMEADKADRAHGGDHSEIPLKLFITTASPFPVNVSVSAPKSTNLYHGDQFILTKGIVREISIPKSLRTQETGRSMKGIRIVASQEIAVFGLNEAKSSTDGFLGIPLDVLGTKYFVPSYLSSAEPFYQSEILIIGTEDSSMLYIRLPPSLGIDIYLDGKSYHSGDWINTTINKFETLQLSCHADLTGTFVLASQKVSVFGGSTVTSVGNGRTRDHIEEQIPPVNVWGKRFAIYKFPDTNPNVLRFLASEDNTVIAIDDKQSINLKRGEFNQTFVDKFSYVSSNKPILSVQYVPSGTCSREVTQGCHKGDPAMALVPPLEQSNIFYSFSTPISSINTTFNNIFMFVIENSHVNNILLDNKTLEMRRIKDIVNSNNLTTGYIEIPHGSHTIEHSSKIVPFGGMLYGGIVYESYAFPVGQRFATINEDCRPQRMDVGDGVDDCDGRVDEEICNDFKDNDGDGRTDEDCLKALSTTTTTTTLTSTTRPATKSTLTKVSTTKTVTSTTQRTTTSRKTTLTATPKTTKTTRTSKVTASPTATLPTSTTVPTRTTLLFVKTKPTTTTKHTAIIPIRHGGKSRVDSGPLRPHWLTYTGYGIIGCVSLVLIGALGMCCKKCFGLLTKRDDDDDEDEEKYRRKMYNKTRKVLGAPSIRPMYL